jgi:hypothetical protein
MMMQDLDRAEALLLTWADFMRRPEPIAEGYPAKASGGFVESWIKDSEELSDAADLQEIGKIKASIDSLSQPHQRIIHKVHGISYMVWSFPNEDALYHAAKAAFDTHYFCGHK